MKSFLVLGLGRFGVTVAKTLCSLGNEVLAVDKNAEIVNDIAEDVTHAIVGDMCDENVLRSFGVTNFDAVIVADLGALRAIKQAEPRLEVHISTQANCCNYAAANAYYEMGASRVVLAREMTIEEMKQYIMDHMARHKVPKYIEFVKSFPMNAAGKVLKYKMREDATKRLGLENAAGIDTGKGAN